MRMAEFVCHRNPVMALAARHWPLGTDRYRRFDHALFKTIDKGLFNVSVPFGWKYVEQGQCGMDIGTTAR
jgi:hypothetical protein